MYLLHAGWRFCKSFEAGSGYVSSGSYHHRAVGSRQTFGCCKGSVRYAERSTDRGGQPDHRGGRQESQDVYEEFR